MDFIDAPPSTTRPISYLLHSLTSRTDESSNRPSIPHGLPYLRELLLSRTRGQQAGTPTVESPHKGEETTDDAASSDVQVSLPLLLSL